MEPEPATTAKFLLDQAVSLSPLEPAQFTGLASTGSCSTVMLIISSSIVQNLFKVDVTIAVSDRDLLECQ